MSAQTSIICHKESKKEYNTMTQLLWKFSLAATLPAGHDLTALPYPLYASPKLDGVRGGVQGGILVSRNGRPIANAAAQNLFGRKVYEGLDGELTAGPSSGPDVFNRTVRVTQRRDANAADLRFNVFDCHDRSTTFTRRYDELRATMSQCAGVGIHIVKQTLIAAPRGLTKAEGAAACAAQLQVFEEKCLAQGYEGVMLRRDTAGPYMEKRSTLREFALVKFKRFDYSEARIVAIHPLEHNLTNGKTATGARSTKRSGITVDASQIGSATVRDVKSGVEFNISVSGDALRAWPGWQHHGNWLNIKIRYKFFPTGNVAKPRFPTADFKELL